MSGAMDGSTSKRPLPPGKMSKKKKQKLQANSRSEGSADEVISMDIKNLIQQNKATDNNQPQPGAEEPDSALPEPFTKVAVEITSLSSTGDGLGYDVDDTARKHVYAVPFTLPGDIALAKVVRHDFRYSISSYTQTDFVRVLRPSPDRDDSLVKCRYFASCGGCHFQMLPYDKQLAHKRTVVEKAYRGFSGLPEAAVPDVRPTIGSPLQYGYRTKLTPHFDAPPGGRKAARMGERVFHEVPKIGFMKKGTKWTLDVEECPIGTAALQVGLKRERKKVADRLASYKKGATILLRESTVKDEKAETKEQVNLDGDGRNNAILDEKSQTVREASLQDPSTTLIKTCISDHHATSTEYVGDFIFRNPANAFFQNNNSILPTFTSYIRDNIFPSDNAEAQKITNLIDAYCGSGLFTITLSSLFKRSVGIDISIESIEFARTNAALNNLTLATPAASPRSKKRDRKSSRTPSVSPTRPSTSSATSPTEATSSTVDFTSGTASNIFASAASFDPLETAVVIDPPRKGCDEDFLRQLVRFKPARIVYVSCNVHTQARDVGWILTAQTTSENGHPSDGDATEDSSNANLSGDYEIESLRGFDFFPQTSHVESVAVLRLKK